MKKGIVIFLLVSILAFVFCSTVSAVDEKAPMNPFTFRNIPVKEGQITVRIANHAYAPWASVAAQQRRFMEIVSVLSDNAINFEWYTAGSLGNETDMAQMLQLGSLDIVSIATNNFSGLAPEVGYYLLPYMFMNLEEVWYIQDGTTEWLNEKITKHGLRIIGWETMGFRHFYYKSDDPIEYPEDLKKLKFRTPSNDIMVDTYKSWGASPVPMAWPETFSAFQQGVIDGGDNPVDDIITASLVEPANRVTKLHYMVLTHPMLMSEKFFQSLPKDIQEIFTEAGKQSTQYVRWWVNLNNEMRWGQIKDAGVTITEVKDEERWAELARTVWPKYYEKLGGKEIVDKISNMLEEYRKK